MRLFKFLLLFILPLIAQGQYSETIRTGRPGIAIGTFTVGSNVFQIQSGVNFGKSELESDQTNSFNSIVIARYGIFEKFEINGAIGYTENKITSENEMVHQDGISAAQIGFRVNLRDGHGSGPNIGFQSRLKLNVLDQDFDQQHLANVSVLAISQKLTKKIGLLTNLAINWSGNEDPAAGLYAINLNMPVSERISVFLENYGRLYKQDLDTRFDTGMGYRVNANLQFDFSFGYGRNEQVGDYFADFGISWRTVGNRMIN